MTLRKWLVTTAIHIGVQRCITRGGFTLAEVRDEMLELELFDGAADGHVWLLDVPRLGPFTRKVGTVDTLELMAGAAGVVTADDYPLPVPRPAPDATPHALPAPDAVQVDAPQRRVLAKRARG